MKTTSSVRNLSKDQTEQLKWKFRKRFVFHYQMDVSWVCQKCQQKEIPHDRKHR